jgi:hypothetical protein
MSKRELANGNVIDIPTAEESLKLADEATRAEANRAQAILKLMRSTIISDIGDDLEENVTSLVTAYGDLVKLLVSKGLISNGELTSIAADIALTKTAKMAQLITIADAAVTNGDSVEDFKAAIDAL